MSNHRMNVEVLKDLGKTVFTCVTCHRQLEIATSDGKLKILHHGDTTALHRAGSFPGAAGLVDEMDTEIEPGNAPGRSLH